jgi:AcrR family transcriptional regulator
MAASKKDLIAQGALTAFAQYGYSDTTMDTIAEVAQVAKGTLYYHFSTKEELFLFVIEKGVKMLIDSVNSAMQDSNLSADERMVCVLDEHLRFFSEHQELCLLLLSFFTGDEQRDQAISTLLAGYFSTMEKYLAELKGQGHLKPDADVRTLASAMFGMTGFTVLRKQFRKEPVDTEETRQTLRSLLHGVLGRKEW